MLYIHIPYCKGKCIYCDFYSGGNPLWEKYLKAVASELSERIDELRGDCLNSIYIGGGTPSLIPAKYFEMFMSDIRHTLSENGIYLANDPELTIEVNPEDVDKEKIDVWKEGGINRVSVGVQSLDDMDLNLMRRRHSAAKAISSVNLLREHFNNISIDIIYGIPGQTKASLQKTINGLISLKPQHISAYSLTYEPNTVLTMLRDRGNIVECSEREYLVLGNLVSDSLEINGYERYEISNYAIAGFKSRHNSGYWKSRPYVGLGPSASSFNGINIRRTNNPDLKAYIKYFNSPPTDLKTTLYYETEVLSRKERLEEIIMISLRTKDGLDLSLLTQKERTALCSYAARWVESGHLKFEGDSLCLTRKGINISDYIILDLI